LIVMKRPDHDICVQTGKADEERARALILKTCDVDTDFVEGQVIRLARDVSRAERTADHRRVRGEKSHAIDRVEVAFSFDAVAELNRSEAPRVGDYQIGSAVGGRTEQITSAGRGALGGECLGRIAVAVDIERIDERTQNRARNTTGHAGGESVCVVVAVERETRIGTTVN